MKNSTKERLKTIRNLALTGTIVTMITNAGIRMVLNRDYGYNIYNDKNLKITEEEQDELVKLLESESGMANLDNERDLILTAVINNPNLDEYEKQTIYSLIDLIEDNPYINKKTAYANLRDLDIINTTREDDIDENTVGRYLPANNTIEIYETDIDKNILRHELIHCIFSNSHTFILPRYFNEGVTELLVDEYFEENPFVEDTSYPYEIAMIKILCEMVGTDTVLETYSTGDMSIIYNKLTETMDKDSAKEYLNIIDKMFEDYNDNGKAELEDMSTFLAYTNSYFEKNGINVNEVYEYNKELLINMKNDNSDNDYISYVINNGYYKKPYFSSKLKEETKKNYLETDSSKVFEKIL